MNTEKEFLDIFKSKCGKLNAWQAWSSIIGAIACGLSNVIDPDPDRFKKREEEYKHHISILEDDTIPAQAYALIVEAFEENPAQDFLGKMFMSLGLGSHWGGQFFTPYNVAKSMAHMSITDTIVQEIKDKGYISVNDSACGAGATLIGAVSAFKERKVNFQDNVCFIANDIDRTTAQMCYIQLSTLGCAGYVVVTDTLTNPTHGSVLYPSPQEGQEYWFMPMWWNDVWVFRRIFHQGVRK